MVHCCSGRRKALLDKYQEISPGHEIPRGSDKVALCSQRRTETANRLRPGWFSPIAFIAVIFAIMGCTSAPTLTPTAQTTPEPTPGTTLPQSIALPQSVEDSSLLQVMEKLPAFFKEEGVWFNSYARALEITGAPQ